MVEHTLVVISSPARGISMSRHWIQCKRIVMTNPPQWQRQRGYLIDQSSVNFSFCSVLSADESTCRYYLLAKGTCSETTRLALILCAMLFYSGDIACGPPAPSSTFPPQSRFVSYSASFLRPCYRRPPFCVAMFDMINLKPFFNALTSGYLLFRSSKPCGMTFTAQWAGGAA